MLPGGNTHGRRLAAVLPTALRHLTAGRVRSVVVLVVDGLGWVNLRSNTEHAPQLSALTGKRITTVAPSTTAAAITSITTGTLPAAHGLVGYRILNPATGTLTMTLKQWDEIDTARSWQLQPTVFERAAKAGIKSLVCARPAHETSGFTGAVLTGAEYRGGQRIAERLAQAAAAPAAGYGLVYAYVDELDKAGHHYGAASAQWRQRLKQLDSAVGDLVAALPADCALVLTADHGMIDIDPARLRSLEQLGCVPPGTVIGGEPRCRYLYLADPSLAECVAAEIRRVEGDNCWVGTRAEWFAAGVFGAEPHPLVSPRFGDVILVPRKRIAYVTDTAPGERTMVGMHGGLDDDELGVPLLAAGALPLSHWLG